MIDEREQRGALRDALPRIDAPAGLEDRVRTTLAARGLVGTRANGRSRWLAGASLVAAGFLLGFLVRGSSRSSRPAESDGKPGQYALLLYGVPPEDTGVVHAARAKEYGQWASALSNGARWTGGHELAGVIATLGAVGAAEPDRRDRVAGFFIIEAESPERAIAVAQSCPHLKYGGRIVVMAVAT
jgi:hypothetical protein